MANLVELIRQASNEAYEASKPVQINYGTVTSVNPLAIKISDYLVLQKNALILPEHLTKRTFNLVIEGYTRSATEDNSLKEGDKVVLIRQKGGQKYLIFDRVVS